MKRLYRRLKAALKRRDASALAELFGAIPRRTADATAEERLLRSSRLRVLTCSRRPS
jgi:hypothetical protein